MFKKSYPMPAENIEPDIERLLTIPLASAPGPFEGHLKPEQLNLLKDEPGVVDMLIGLDKLEQGQDWLIQQSLNSNRQRRRMEAAIIRLRNFVDLEIEKVREDLEAERRLREEKQRFLDDKSKLDLWPVIVRAILWGAAVGLATYLGVKLGH